MPTEPHAKDIDVFLKRDIETGFGFRVLGGEGPQQPVSVYMSVLKVYFNFWLKLYNFMYLLDTDPVVRVCY